MRKKEWLEVQYIKWVVKSGISICGLLYDNFLYDTFYSASLHDFPVLYVRVLFETHALWKNVRQTEPEKEKVKEQEKME